MNERVKYRVEKCTPDSIHVNIIKAKNNGVIFKLRLNAANVGKCFSETQGNEELWEKHTWNGPATTPIKQMHRLSQIIQDVILLRETTENGMAAPSDKWLDYHQTGFRAKDLDVPKVLTITLENLESDKAVSE